MSAHTLLSPEALDAIRKRWAAASRGPWKWDGFKSVPVVELQDARKHTVLGFVRWGEEGAQPLFKESGQLRRLHELKTGDGSDLISRIEAPDAEAIAYSWEDVHALFAHVEALAAERDEAERLGRIVIDERDEARQQRDEAARALEHERAERERSAWTLQQAREEGRQQGLYQAAAAVWDAVLESESMGVKLAAFAKDWILALLPQSKRLYSEEEHQRSLRWAYEEGFREGLEAAARRCEAAPGDRAGTAHILGGEQCVRAVRALVAQPVPPRARCRTCPEWCEGTRRLHGGAGPCRDCGCSAWAPMPREQTAEEGEDT